MERMHRSPQRIRGSKATHVCFMLFQQCLADFYAAYTVAENIYVTLLDSRQCDHQQILTGAEHETVDEFRAIMLPSALRLAFIVIAAQTCWARAVERVRGAGP